ncbi:DUF6663 family protein [Halobaculum sp. MBLA0147]|uniref:DUF6663 family protein n=1 Tax=Halobaculum sp. MBLA0147 TaxID=3079934 RepID=UPI00352385F8
MTDDTPGRYRVHARITRDGESAFVLIDCAETDDPAEAYEPVVVAADGYEGALAETVAELETGNRVAATLDWTGPDATASFETLSVERRTRFRFADEVEGLFEAARDAWEAARRDGDAVNARVTRDTDGEPNGSLYVFGDPAGRDVFHEFRSGRRPIDPLVERVDEAAAAREGDEGEDEREGGAEAAGAGRVGGSDGGSFAAGSLASRLPQADEETAASGDEEQSAGDRTEQADEDATAAAGDGTERGGDAVSETDGLPPREVFVLRPVDGAFVVVYVVFRRDGLLAETVRDTYESLAE